MSMRTSVVVKCARKRAPPMGPTAQFLKPDTSFFFVFYVPALDVKNLTNLSVGRFVRFFRLFHRIGAATDLHYLLSCVFFDVHRGSFSDCLFRFSAFLIWVCELGRRLFSRCADQSTVWRTPGFG